MPPGRRARTKSPNAGSKTDSNSNNNSNNNSSDSNVVNDNLYNSNNNNNNLGPSGQAASPRRLFDLYLPQRMKGPMTSRSRYYRDMQAVQPGPKDSRLFKSGFYPFNALRVPSSEFRLHRNSLPVGLQSKANMKRNAHTFLSHKNAEGGSHPLEQRMRQKLSNIPSVASEAFRQFIAKDLWKLSSAFTGTQEDVLHRLHKHKSVGKCGAKDISTVQSVTRLITWLAAFDPKRSKPGLLALASTGSGKTLMGLITLLANWDRKTPDGRPYPVVFVSNAGTSRGNDTYTLAGLAIRFFKGFVSADPSRPRPFDLNSPEDVAYRLQHVTYQGKPVGTLTPDWETWPDAIRIVADRIGQRIKQGIRTLYAPRTRLDDAAMQRRLHSFTTLYNDMFNVGEHEQRGAPLKLRKAVVVDRDGKIPHAVFVTDEIQLLFSPPPTEAAKGKYSFPAIEHLLNQKRSVTGTFCLALTATPGENLSEACRVLDIVAGCRGKFKSLADIQQSARGMVSYSQLQGDARTFAKLTTAVKCVPLAWYDEVFRDGLKRLAVTAPDKLAGVMERVAGDAGAMFNRATAAAAAAAARNAKVVQNKANAVAGGRRRTERLGKQVEFFKVQDAAPKPKKRKALTEEQLERRRREYVYSDKDKYRYWQGLTALSNYRYISKTPREETEELMKTAATHGALVKGASGPSYIASPKLVQLADVLCDTQRYPGKHYVYCSNKKSLAVLGALLEARGMKYWAPDCRQNQQTKKTVCGNMPQGHAPRFTSLDSISFKDFPQFERADSAFTRKWVISALDAPDNVMGSKVRAVFAYNQDFKAVDLRGLRYIHNVSALSDAASFIQLLGRGPRFCSHTDLPPALQTVTALMWRLSGGGDAKNNLQSPSSSDIHQLLADHVVFAEAADRYKKNMLPVMDALQQVSVDRDLFATTLHAPGRGVDVRAILDSACQSGKYRQQLNAANTGGGGPSKKTLQRSIDTLFAKLEAAKGAARAGPLALKIVKAIHAAHRSVDVQAVRSKLLGNLARKGYTSGMDMETGVRTVGHPGIDAIAAGVRREFAEDAVALGKHGAFVRSPSANGSGSNGAAPKRLSPASRAAAQERRKATAAAAKLADQAAKQAAKNAAKKAKVNALAQRLSNKAAAKKSSAEAAARVKATRLANKAAATQKVKANRMEAAARLTANRAALRVIAGAAPPRKRGKVPPQSAASMGLGALGAGKNANGKNARYQVVAAKPKELGGDAKLMWRLIR